MAQAERLRGSVKTIHRAKGFAFIRGDDRKDYFAYYQSFKSDDWEVLRDGMRVTFVAGEGAKGPRAENIAVIHE